jgi:hypothetical protein
MQVSTHTSLYQKIATRYFSNSSIFLLIALLLGGAVRWKVIEGREFPLNDGGFWYVFANALISNDFTLPSTVYFNGGDLPTYYPPLAAYFIAALSKALSIDVLVLLLWIPFILSVLMILVFYYLACKLYPDVIHPRFAVIIFALYPDSYRWFLMGGGVSRSLGIIFMMGSIGLLLNHDLNYKKIVLAGICIGLAILSHPVAGLLTIISIGILIFLSRIRVSTALITGSIASGLVLPWLLLVVNRVGITPFISAFMTGKKSLLEPLDILTSLIVSPPFSILSAFFILGFAIGVFRYKQYSILLLFSMAIFSPLFLVSGHGSIPLTLICSEGAVLIYLLLGSSSITQQFQLQRVLPIIVVMFISFYFINSLRSANAIGKQTMSNAQFREIQSLQLPKDSSSAVLILTNHEVIGDAVGEWLGSFTKYKSVITHQMGEWNGDRDKMLKIHDQLTNFIDKKCSERIVQIKEFFPEISYVITANNWQTSFFPKNLRVDMYNSDFSIRKVDQLCE